MTSAFAHLGTIRTAEAGPRAPREFSAFGRAVDWINSSPLTPERLAGKVVLVNVWTYSLNGGPVVDGDPLDFVQTSQPWLPCTRTYIAPIDSVGVTVSYNYRARTPLQFFFPFFNLLKITDRAVMSMNVAK